MFHINVLLRVKSEDDVAEIKDLLRQAATLSREEPGCERFEAYHSQSDNLVFILTEWWETEESWKVHRNERAFQEIYQPQILPRVDRTPHICSLVE